MYTPKANIPSVSQHFLQHDLSLNHPELPSDRNRPESEGYFNPHHPQSGGFRPPGTVTGEKVGHPTQVTVNQWSTPIHRHVQGKKRAGTYPGDPLVTSHTTAGVSILVDSNTPAWKRLIDHPLPQSEVISIIDSIITSKDELKMICNLRGDDAQTLINTIHEV